MGLSAPKQRAKISEDPNNNTWSRSTDRFGHKILTAQGWKPGNYLGAKNANHSRHYTAANASHIRILLKDDNLGLGAKRGREANAETFGLNAFQGLLGRLNGKSGVQLKKEEHARRDVQLTLYQGQRWGCVKFVSGGFLVGDKIENPASALPNHANPVAKIKTPVADLTAQPGVRVAKKRKREEEDMAAQVKAVKSEKAKSDLESNIIEDGEQAAKRERRKYRKICEAADPDSGSLSPSILNGKARNKRQKLEKKAGKEAKRLRLATEKDDSEQTVEQSIGPITSADPEPSGPLLSDEQSEKRRRKLEKQTKKEAKRLKKQRRKKPKSPDNSSDDESKEPDTSSSASDSTSISVAAPKPAVSFSGGRHAVRQRYIQQKKMASLDPQALKEIFMIKSPA